MGRGEVVTRPTPPGAQVSTTAPMNQPGNASPAGNEPPAEKNEVAELKAQVEEFKAKERARSKAIRTLAATLLMPDAQADGGAAKKMSLRSVLLEVVNQFAPEEESE